MAPNTIPHPKLNLLPQLNLIALGVIHPGKLAIRLVHALIVDAHVFRCQLSQERVEVFDAKIDHGLLRCRVIVRGFFECRENEHATAGLPRCVVGGWGDAKRVAIPGVECVGVFSAKENAADAENLRAHMPPHALRCANSMHFCLRPGRRIS